MKKILVIEDEKDILENVIELLALEGFNAVGAENGAIGLARAIEYLPDLILCDIRMPELNGFEVLQRLRQNPDTLSIPVVILSARITPEEIAMLDAMPLVSYLHKPFEIEDFIGTVDYYLTD